MRRRPARAFPRPATAGAGRVAAQLCALGAVTASAGSGFHRAFEAPVIAGCLAAGTALPVAVSAVRLRLARPAGPAAVIGAYAGVWFATATIMSVLLGADGSPATLRGDLFDGTAWLLDTTLPAPPEPRLLTLPFTALFAAAAAGAELTLRTRHTLAPTVPALALFAFSAVLTVPGSGSNVPTAMVLAATTAGYVLVRRAVSRQPLDLGAEPSGTAKPTTLASPGAIPRARDRRRRAVALLLVVAAGPAVAALPILKHRPTVDPRTYRPATAALPDDISPLSRVSDWLSHPDEVLFTVRTADPSRLRLAVFDRFDGSEWTMLPRFTRAGLGVPPGDGSTTRAGTRPVRQEITTTGLTGSFLPAVDRPVRLHGDNLLVDVETGVLATPAGVHPGLRYTVESAPVADPPEATADAGPPSAVDSRDGMDGAATPAGRTPPAVRALVRAATRSGDSPYQQAARLADYLRTSGLVNDPLSPPGHSWQRVERFLNVWRRGTTEQFAAVYALAASSMGLPVRLVVGFDPGQPAAHPPVTGGGASDAETGQTRLLQVRGRDVRVWAEVRIDGIGWVAFDPTPAASTEHVPQEDTVTIELPAATQAEPASSPPPPPPPQVGSEHGLGPLPDPAVIRPPSPRPRAAESRTTLFVLCVLLALMVLLYVAVVTGVPAARRRYARRAGTTRDRAVAAWHDGMLHLAQCGVSLRPPLTTEEIVQGASSVVGEHRHGELRVLADIGDRTLYSSARLLDADVARAWAAADVVRRQASRSQPRWRRCRTALSPRNLRGASSRVAARPGRHAPRVEDN